MVPYTGPTAITTGMPWVGRLAILKDSNGRIQPITARPAGNALLARPACYYNEPERYIGNSDLTRRGAGGIAWQQSIYGIRDQLDNAPIYGGGSQPRRVSAAGPRRPPAWSSRSRAKRADRTISKKPVDWKTQEDFFHRPQSEVRSRPGIGATPRRARLSRRQGDFWHPDRHSNVPAAAARASRGDQASSTAWTTEPEGTWATTPLVGAGAHISEFWSAPRSSKHQTA